MIWALQFSWRRSEQFELLIWRVKTMLGLEVLFIAM